MSNILLYLLIILMGIMGGLSSVIVLVMIPVVLIRKFYGKIRYGKKSCSGRKLSVKNAK